MNSGDQGYLSRFLGWWLGELRACLPGALSGVLFGASDGLEVDLGDDEARLAMRRSGKLRELGQVSLDDASAKAVRKLLRRDGASIAEVTLRMPASQVLQSRIELPIAAAENLREVLAFEMDRYTPFSAKDVLFDFQVTGSDAELERLNIALLVARRDDVRAALALAGGMGLSVDRVTAPENGSTEGHPFNLLEKSERPRTSRTLPRLVAGMAVVTLVLAGVALNMSYVRKQKTLELYEDRVAELRAETGETGRLSEKVAQLADVSGYLLAKKQRKLQVAEILDELTQRLPDEHYLISLSIRDGAAQLAGYSDDPSSLLRLLEQSKLFSEVRFAAPVTMDPRIGKERFNISATVDREAGTQ